MHASTTLVATITQQFISAVEEREFILKKQPAGGSKRVMAPFKLLVPRMSAAARANLCKIFGPKSVLQVVKG